MAAITICSDFGAPQNKAWHCFHCFPIYFPWSDGTRCHDLFFWMLSFKPTFSLSTFTFLKRLFSSSLSAIRVVLSAYLRLLIFLPTCQEQVNLFPWLCSAILGLLYLCQFWVSPVGSDGLWPVQDRQQPLALCGQYVQQGVLPACGWGFPSGNGRCSDTQDISIPFMLLWVKWD